MTIVASLEQDLLHDQWFASVPKERRELLLALGRTQEVDASHHVFRLGDPPAGLYAVLEGEVRLISYPASGRERVSLQLFPGGWFGELSVLDGEPRAHDAVAHERSRLLFIGRAAFEAAVRETPELVRDLARLLARRLRQAMTHADTIAFQRLRVRVARMLLGLKPARHDDDTAAGTPWHLSLTQDELAEVAGASRQAVNRELKNFEAEGHLELKYGSLLIHNWLGLEKIAHPDQP